MQPFPHVYSVTAAGNATGNVSLNAPGVPRLMSAAPSQFGGAGDQWSPESLLVAAIASCFILSFKSVARASHLEWLRLECDVGATLERVENVTRFTRVVVRATLSVPESVATLMGERALTKADHHCLIANSLRCERELLIEVVREPADEPMAAEDLS